MEFGSRAWIEELRTAFVEASAGGHGLDFSMSEVYLEPPAHLAPAAVGLGWHMRIRAGQVEFVFTPSADVDVHIAADYTAILPLARLTYGDDATERDGLVADLVTSGRLRVTGDMSTMPACLSGVHNRMAAITD